MLDLCCAPGGKLILSSFLQGEGTRKNKNFNDPINVGTLTGVDLSEHRLATCRSMMKKYGVECGRLFCGDGTKFGEPVKRFLNVASTNISTDNIRKRAFHETTAFRKRPTGNGPSEYDKVLVDSQCTHDGSIKHIRKHSQQNWKGFDLTQFHPSNLKKLHDLQYALLENGFNLLKSGGILVYSTCSLSRAQNEEIIEKFVHARGEEIKGMPFEGSDEMGRMRMCPPEDDSGFFICRLSKR